MMNLLEILSNQYLGILFGSLVGIVSTLLTQSLRNRRGVFSYFVNHNKVGMSATDSVFGTVSVTWNDKPVQHLFLSTIELKNESFNDYENVVVQTYTNDTDILSESTQILDTPNIIEWTENYRTQIYANPGQEPTKYQVDKYFRQREYSIPVFNRGQTVRISYLNSAISENLPNIWLHVAHKGVKVKFRVPEDQVFGIPRAWAAFVGVVIGLIGLIPLVLVIANPWAVAFIAMIYGFVVTLPGAYAIRALRKIREMISG